MSQESRLTLLGRVYFIRAGYDGAIKIGVSQDPQARLRELQTAHHEQLHLLGTVDGGCELERALHVAFKEDSLRGEWFKPSAPLLAFIEAKAEVPGLTEKPAKARDPKALSNQADRIQNGWRDLRLAGHRRWRLADGQEHPVTVRFENPNPEAEEAC